VAVGHGLVWEQVYAELFAPPAGSSPAPPDVRWAGGRAYEPTWRDPLTPGRVAGAEASGVRFLGHREKPPTRTALRRLRHLRVPRTVRVPPLGNGGRRSAPPIVATTPGFREVVEGRPDGCSFPSVCGRSGGGDA